MNFYLRLLPRTRSRINLASVIFILILCTFIFVRLTKYGLTCCFTTQVDKVIPKSTSVPTVSPEITQDFKNLDPVPSNNGKFLSSLRLKRKSENLWTVSLMLSGRSHEFFPIHPNENFPKSWWSFDINENSQYFKYLSTDIIGVSKIRNRSDLVGYLAWSDKGDKLAFTTPDKIIIFEFEILGTGSTILNNDEKTEHVLKYQSAIKLIDTIEFPNPSNYLKSGFTKMFFEGDGNRLYISFDSSNNLYQADLKTHELILTSKNTMDTFPIPSRAGLAYWENKSGENKKIILELPSGKQSFEIPDSNNIDYTGRILVSPDLGHACIEWGSSGYWGYQILTLSPINKLRSGLQYSYCRNWKDNTKVILSEVPYHSGGAWLFEYDVLNEKETFLDNY